MRFFAWSLFLFMPIVARAATVVDFGVTLCDGDRVMSSGECLDMARGMCPAGYYQPLIGDATFAAHLKETDVCNDTYNTAVMSEYFRPIYSELVDFGAALCGPNQVMSSGECVDIVRGVCPAGYYQPVINAATFAAHLEETEACNDTHNTAVISEYFRPIYSGLVDFGATFCGPGQYLSSGVCVAQTQGECSENSFAIDATDTTLLPRTDSECATGYKSFWLNANCASDQVQSGMCATLCDAGLSYTGSGTCAMACSVNPGRNVMLKSATGISIQLYPTRMTTPSLNVLTSTGQVCYGNLTPGVQSGAINVTVSGQDYHITD